MKLLTLVAMIITSMSVVAHAEQICETEDSLGVHYQMSYSADSKLYKVFVYGRSRNHYEAVYKIADRSAFTFAYIDTLVKLDDLSTWKDMPENLVVTTSSRAYLLFNSASKAFVEFPFARCKQNPFGIKPQSSVIPPNWCHTPGRSKLC